MTNAAHGSSARPGSRRSAVLKRALALLALAAVAVGAVAVLRGGDDDPASELAGRKNAPACDAPGNNPSRSSLCPETDRFEVARFLRHGDAYDCTHFATQADAQAVLKADPTDPNDLDPDGDGRACLELVRDGPRDLTPVKSIADRQRCRRADERTARCPQRERRFDPQRYVALMADVYDCEEFASQADAQAVLRFTPDDPNTLDGDGDGIACPDLPAPKDLEPVLGRPEA